jgi:hypothetical protein
LRKVLTLYGYMFLFISKLKSILKSSICELDLFAWPDSQNLVLLLALQRAQVSTKTSGSLGVSKYELRKPDAVFWP